MQLSALRSGPNLRNKKQPPNSAGFLTKQPSNQAATYSKRIFKILPRPTKEFPAHK
ncbi:hypothetical protein HMPREF9104_01546 [Lentilactobacillus kisonensis F0435]|uniref:Uncharacterized protein n=1 Tax=Lentilactobacillus kisonensis F0435 TaxID=797516 RepID=H1LG20_9LACO|nr:hypothetical protein HMPREF9104_01546 [Lentilactobacillus kisonensis F0435]